MLSLEGKVCLVTGSTSGIGLSIAELFAKAGASKVFINGRTEDGVKSAIDKLKQRVEKGVFESAAGDVSSATGCELVFKATGPNVDVVVNNTGIFPVEDFFNITDDSWTNIFNVNVMSGVRVTRYYLKGMLQRNAGRVIFISSESGLVTPPEMIHYGMTKSCQISIARGLAHLCKGTEVTVNSVLPGPTMTGGVEEWLAECARKDGLSVAEEEKKLFKEGSRSSSLKGSFLTSEEVGNMVLYIASDLSSATNGASLRAEGGIINYL